MAIRNDIKQPKSGEIWMLNSSAFQRKVVVRVRDGLVYYKQVGYGRNCILSSHLSNFIQVHTYEF